MCVGKIFLTFKILILLKFYYLRSISVDLARKRDMITGMLENVGMKPVIPEGGYFIMADWSSLAHKIDLSSESDPQRDYR